MSSERVVIITGAASGIGAATAKYFAASGYKKLALVDLKDELLKAVSAECQTQENVEVLDIVVDLSDTEKAKDVVSRVVKHFGRKAKTYIDAAIPHLEKTRGNIVFTSSTLSQKPIRSMGAYASSKAAINMLSKTIALEEGAKGIRSNVVWPAAIATNFHVGTPVAGGGATFTSLDQIREFEAFKAVHAVGRVGEPEEVARAIAFLADSKSGFITGAQLAIDGGHLVL